MQIETTIESLTAEIVGLEAELVQIASRKETAIAAGDYKANKAAETARADAESRLEFARARHTKATHDQAEAARAAKLSKFAVHAEACSLATYRNAIRTPIQKLVDAIKAAVDAHDEIAAVALNTEAEEKNAAALAAELRIPAPANIRPPLRALAEIAVAISDQIGSRAGVVGACAVAFEDNAMGSARVQLLEHVSRLLGTGTVTGYDIEEQLKCAIEGTQFNPRSERKGVHEVAA